MVELGEGGARQGANNFFTDAEESPPNRLRSRGGATNRNVDDLEDIQRRNRGIARRGRGGAQSIVNDFFEDAEQSPPNRTRSRGGATNRNVDDLEDIQRQQRARARASQQPSSLLGEVGPVGNPSAGVVGDEFQRLDQPLKRTPAGPSSLFRPREVLPPGTQSEGRQVDRTLSGPGRQGTTSDLFEVDANHDFVLQEMIPENPDAGGLPVERPLGFTDDAVQSPPNTLRSDGQATDRNIDQFNDTQRDIRDRDRRFALLNDLPDPGPIPQTPPQSAVPLDALSSEGAVGADLNNQRRVLNRAGPLSTDPDTPAPTLATPSTGVTGQETPASANEQPTPSTGSTFLGTPTPGATGQGPPQTARQIEFATPDAQQLNTGNEGRTFGELGGRRTRVLDSRSPPNLDFDFIDNVEDDLVNPPEAKKPLLDASSTGIAVMGLQGFTGDPGPRGFTGPDGPVGPASRVPGPPGARGFRGRTGATGAGRQGIQGIQGTQGRQGIQGIQGAQGRQGALGITGTGTPGLQGLVGPPGATGGRGPIGPAGGVGATIGEELGCERGANQLHRQVCCSSGKKWNIQWAPTKKDLQSQFYIPEERRFHYL